MRGICASTAALSAFPPAAAADTAAGVPASARLETVPCTNSRLLRLGSLASAMCFSRRCYLAHCSLEAAAEQSIIPQPCCARGEAVGGSAPVQLVHVREKPRITPERRQLAALAKHTRREVLDGAVAADEACRGRLADPRQAWIPVCGVTDQGEEVRDQMRRHAEFLAHPLRIAYDLGFAVHLNHPLAMHALRQILVRCPDAYLLHPVIFGGDSRSGGERIVGFQLDHGPYRHSQRGERILERM